MVVAAGTPLLHAIGRLATFTGMRLGLTWPMRGFDGGVGWKASRCATSWAPAGRCRRCRRCSARWNGRCRRSRGGMAFQDLVKREASPSFCCPAAGSSLFPYPFPECPDSRIAPGVGRRDEAAPRGCFDLPVEQRDQLVEAREADPDMGFMVRLLPLRPLPLHRDPQDRSRLKRVIIYLTGVGRVFACS